MFVEIFGVFLFLAGPVLIIKSEWFLENFGRIEWAEQHLGTEGGTRTLYKILGLLAIFFGMAILLGLFQGMVLFVFGPLLPKQ